MADLEIDNQYDFFKNVVLDENGAMKVVSGGLSGSASAHFSDSTTQTIAVINTPQVVSFNTHDDIPLNITHSTTVDNDKICFNLQGRYSISAEFQVHNGSGGGELFVWMETSTDDGATWANIPNSAVVDSLSANTENVLVLTELFDAVNVGDCVRFRMQGDSLGLDLDHRAAAGLVPAVPSAMMTVYLIGASL